MDRALFLVFNLYACFYKLLHCESIDSSIMKYTIVHFLEILGFFKHTELYRLRFSFI